MAVDSPKPRASKPREKASTYPVLGKIVADISLVDGGMCLMPAERFKYWTKLLLKRFPGAKHPKLYQMLGGMALEFAQYQAFGAVQLFALASLGMSEEAAEALADKSDFIRENTAGMTRSSPGGGPATVAGMTKPTAGGVSARKTTRGDR